MKLYIRRQKPNEIILGMATPKSEVLKKLKARNFECISHIVKWYVYRENDSQNHWKEEIASYLAYANHKKLKGNKKLTVSDIMNSLLYGVEDGDESDAESILQDFIWDVARPEKYPEFEISKGLVYSFSLFLQEFKKQVVPMLISNHIYELKEFYPVLDRCYITHPRPRFVIFTTKGE